MVLPFQKVENGLLRDGGHLLKYQECLILSWLGKLKLLKSKLTEWNIAYGGNLKKKKTIQLNQINSFDVLQEQRPLNENELLERASLHMEFQDLAKNKEISWRKRSRTSWLKQGDKNTKFFFKKIANSQIRFNHIDKQEVQGNLIIHPVETRNDIVSYHNLYSET